MPKSLLSPAVEEWLEWRKTARGVARTTSRVDSVHLRRFLGSVGNIQCHNLTSRHVDRALAEATSLQWRAANQYINRLRSFTKFLHLRGYLPRSVDPTAGIAQRRGTPRPIRHLPAAKFAALLDAAGNPRDRALLACGLYLFTRQGETRALRVADVDLAGGAVLVTVTKSNVTDRMAIPAELDRELRAWLTAYTLECGPLAPEWFLFPSRRPHGTPDRGPNGVFLPGTAVMLHDPVEPIADPGIIARNALEQVGFPVRDSRGESLHAGSHVLRASGARAWYDHVSAVNPRALKIVSARLHHKNVATTEHYLGVQIDKTEGDDLLRGAPMLPELAESSGRVVSLRHG